VSAFVVNERAGHAVEAPLLSIVIVHYNTLELTRACLESIARECAHLPHEIFLVDNGSSDASGLALARDFPALTLLRLEQGIGYGAANNLAARRSKGRYLLFLNSDTVVQNNALGQVAAFLDEHPRAVLAGCRLLKSDGSLDSACRRSFPTPTNAMWKMLGLNRRFPNSRLFAAYDLRYLPADGRYEVDSLVGAFMMGRRDALPSAPFDEDYFFYGEDIDLCYTVKQRGGQVWYLGDVVMLHRKGGTTNKREPWVIRHFHASMAVFYDKHYRTRYPWLLSLAVHVGIRLRLVAFLLANAFKSRSRT